MNIQPRNPSTPRSVDYLPPGSRENSRTPSPVTSEQESLFADLFKRRKLGDETKAKELLEVCKPTGYYSQVVNILDNDNFKKEQLSTLGILISDITNPKRSKYIIQDAATRSLAEN